MARRTLVGREAASLPAKGRADVVTGSVSAAKVRGLPRASAATAVVAREHNDDADSGFWPSNLVAAIDGRNREKKKKGAGPLRSLALDKPRPRADVPAGLHFMGSVSCLCCTAFQQRRGLFQA